MSGRQSFILRLTAVVGQHPGRVILAIGAAMLVAYGLAMGVLRAPGDRIVFGDATHCFVQLRSMVFDHDLDFRDEYMRLYGLSSPAPGTEWVFTELTVTGHVRNYMPVGPALLWAPLYVTVAGTQDVLAQLGLTSPPDGYGRWLQMAPGITGILATIWAVWICFQMAARVSSRESAAFAAVVTWLGSHAIYYSLISPTYTHAPSMLTAALFFDQWLRGREAPSSWRAARLGALAGLCALMRWQDAIFIAVPLLDLLVARIGWVDRARAAIVLGIAFVVVFSPQMIVWRVLYGAPLALPQGPSFMHWTTPHLAAVLFSDNHGLFTWAPLLLLAVWGLIQFCRRHPRRAPAIAFVLLTSWYVNAAVADWWAGEAFGARRFLSLFPLFVLGLAVWLDAIGRPGAARARRAVAALVLVGCNGLLLLQYELAMKGLQAVAPYPHGLFDMFVARLVVPFRLWMWWRS
jgi:hypothetical protein